MQYETHGLDTQNEVFFYEQEFYVLSNFSAFTINWKSLRFDTSEAAYHWEKFAGTDYDDIRAQIRLAPSAHRAFEIAQSNKMHRRSDWDEVKAGIMSRILWAKVHQHDYVMKKLLETGHRRLVENSWRDDVWGWGPNKDGLNLLGVLWEQVRYAIQHNIDMYPDEPELKRRLS